VLWPASTGAHSGAGRWCAGWEQAHDPYAKVIITAAVEAGASGAGIPVAAEFLACAVPGYLTPAQYATAPADWLKRALEYLKRALEYVATPSHGAALTLAQGLLAESWFHREMAVW
jgi:hypothetical protein